MNLSTSLIQSLKTAIYLSKIIKIKDKIVTKYHKIDSVDRLKENHNINKFSNFRVNFYKHHILDLANDLSKEEQEVSLEVLAEPEVQLFEADKEIDDIINIEDLFPEEKIKPDRFIIPEGSRVVRIICIKGIIVQKNYLTQDNKEITLIF